MTGCLCIHDQCKHLWCLCPFILCLELLGRRSLVPGQLEGVTTPQAAQHCSSAAVGFRVITSARLAQHARIILCAACKVLHVMFKYSHACLCCVQHYIHNTIVILYLLGYISTPRCGHGVQWVRLCIRRSKSTAGQSRNWPQYKDTRESQTKRSGTKDSLQVRAGGTLWSTLTALASPAKPRENHPPAQT